MITLLDTLQTLSVFMWRKNINDKGGLCLDHFAENCVDFLKRNVSIQIWIYTSVYLPIIISFLMSRIECIKYRNEK